MKKTTGDEAGLSAPAPAAPWGRDKHLWAQPRPFSSSGCTCALGLKRTTPAPAAKRVRDYIDATARASKVWGALAGQRQDLREPTMRESVSDPARRSADGEGAKLGKSSVATAVGGGLCVKRKFLLLDLQLKL